MAVIKCDGLAEVDQITVPVEDDSNSRLALDLLPALSARWQARPKVLALAPEGTWMRSGTPDFMEKLIKDVELSPEVPVTVISGAPFADKILAEAGPKGIIVMGEPSWSGLSRLLALSISDVVAERSSQMVILLKAYNPRPKRSLLVRLLIGA